MISIFGNKSHAERWLGKWLSNNDGSFSISCIKTDSTYKVFRAIDLVSVLDIPLHPHVNMDWFRDEYLIFRNIYDSGIHAMKVTFS